MNIRLSGPATATGGTRAPLAMGLGVVGVSVLVAVAGLWWSFGREPKATAAPMSEEGQKLAERGEARRVEAVTEGERLRQKPVGEGYQFDATGQLVGAPADTYGLPQNRHLAQTVPSGPTDPAALAEISRGVDQRRPLDDPAAEKAPAEDRTALTQSMLGYSTVRSATWATRRPQLASTERPSEAPDRAQAASSGEAELLRTMERLGQLGNAGEGQPSAPRPEAASGRHLYPAEESPQSFGRGGVGDMRIGGGVGPDQVVRQGKFLDCVLVNQLKVDLAESPVIAMVSRDFLTLDGQYVLVPAGAKLIGTAGTVQNLQQARVYIKLERIIYPDQRSAFFPVRQVGAADGMGAVGVGGDVDRHFLLQFGAAVMLGMLDGLAAAVQTPGASASPGVRDLVLARTSANFSSLVAGILARYANVVPTVTVEPGAKMKVFFSEDVRMSPYMRASELSWLRR